MKIAPGKPAVVDQRVEAIVWPPSKAHSASLYLSRRFTQDTVMEALDRSRFQPVSPITMKRNLADSLDANATHPRGGGHRRGTAGGGGPMGQTCWRFWCVDGSGAAQSVG